MADHHSRSGPRAGQAADAANAPFAKRSLGQNFLQDKNVARRIVEALDAEPGDAVLEIGPGRGALTEHLAAKPLDRLTLVEKDAALAEALAQRWPQAEVLLTDALTFPWEDLGRHGPRADAGRLRLVGNLPYNIASPLMWEIVSRTDEYARAVFMVQLEVARRLTARPACGEYGALTVWIQTFVTSEMLFVVGPGVFRPRPKVDSAVVLFRPRPGAIRGEEAARLSRLLKISFQQRRKQLGHILRRHKTPELESFMISRGLSLQARPEEVSPPVFLELANFLGTRIAS